MLLWQMASKELGGWCQTSTDRDYKTVSDRVSHEGLSFLTITLPQFASDFQKSLEVGFVDSTSFSGFRKRGGLPMFLSGFLSRVFSDDGKLLSEPDPDAVLAIRQLTLMFGKIALDCTERRNQDAFDRYVQCEKDVRISDQNLDQESKDSFLRISRLLYSDLFSSIDHMVYEGNLIPRHGPGATADRLRANAKYLQREWTRRLEELFPATDFLLPSHRYWRDAQQVNILEPGAERPVRVITVPKTLKTPRIIAIEPTCMQYMQQAILEKLVEGVNRDERLYSFIGFDDQTSNQYLAQQGSITGALATLDLSEASDRVSNQHVRDLLTDFPWLSKAVDASRSRKADVPGHGVIRLAKFASMGSALCFPFEAMVFLTVVLMGIEDALSLRLTDKMISRLVGSVRVYGDDIIVPSYTVSSVVRSLETFGFKVGRDKSFWSGRFRESCGKEYYAGHDVSIVRVRTLLPTQRTDSEALVSTVALRNRFFTSGMWQCARHLDDVLGEFLNLPAVSPTSPSLGLYSFTGYQVDKMDKDTHGPLVKGYVVVPRIPRSRLEGVGALLKFFLKRGDEPHDRKHLESSGRPTIVDIKRRWVRPF
jgi:hypothetical protein